MDDLDIQAKVARWIREVFLPKKFGQPFRQKKLTLQSRTQHEFDAVSDDNEIVAAICLSAGTNATGKIAPDALRNVRSDALWFLMLESTPVHRLMIFTDSTMIDLIKQEKKRDRFPRALEILKVKLPHDLAEELEESQKSASELESPSKDTE
jgi:hypothetical protein